MTGNVALGRHFGNKKCVYITGTVSVIERPRKVALLVAEGDRKEPSASEYNWVHLSLHLILEVGGWTQDWRPRSVKQSVSNAGLEGGDDYE
jgi:hypothetical protein